MPAVRTAPTAHDRARQGPPHRETDIIEALDMRQTWESHQREKRLDRYTHAWVAVIAVVTVAAVGLAWLWLR